MGVTRHCLEFLDDVRRSAGTIDSVLTLGRQNLLLSPSERRALSKRLPGVAANVFEEEYAERAIEAVLRCSPCDTMDASDYEGATVVHDLNRPVSEDLRERYDLIVDGGTLEHVFDVAAALRNIEAMLRPGGVFVSHTVANGFMGHGFYQFSPELFYRAFSRARGFKATRVFVQPLSSSTMAVARFGSWYRATDPDEIGERVLYSIGRPLSMFVVTRKGVPGSGATTCGPDVQQSDYSNLWRVDDGHPARDRRWKAVSLARRVPVLGTLAIHAADQVLMRSGRSLANRRFFKRMSVEDRRAEVAGALEVR